MLWNNVDRAEGNGKPLFANTTNTYSTSTINSTKANTAKHYGNMFGVSANEYSNSTHKAAHAGWISHKVGTGPIKTITVNNAGQSYNTANYLMISDDSWLKQGTGFNASYTIANTSNSAQAFSVNPTMNGISTITIHNVGSGFSNVAAITVTAQGANSTAATFTITLGGRAGRHSVETIVAMGSITGDDPRDNAFYSGV